MTKREAKIAAYMNVYAILDGCIGSGCEFMQESGEDQEKVRLLVQEISESFYHRAVALEERGKK